VRYNARGSRFNPDRLTTVYGFVRAGLDLVLYALTSGARVTMVECMDVIGRTSESWGRSMLACPAGAPILHGALRESVERSDLTNQPLSPTKS